MKKIISIALIIVSIFSFCGCSRLFGRKSEPVQPHLIKSAQKETNPVRYINSKEKVKFDKDNNDTLIDQIADLYDIVAIDKMRPDFASRELNAEVQKVYDAAIKILDRYILNDFTDFERVHAIHDYLTYHIAYDEQLYLSYVNGERNFDDSESFDLRGVFINKTAVCDGLSQAFNFLCAIEGIESERIEGSCSYGGQTVPHTWNKVKLDGEWYNIDTTLDSIVFNTDSGDAIKVIHHGYFLLSDSTLQSFARHSFSGGSSGYDADIDYQFHKDAFIFDEDESSLKAEVTTQEEFNEIFEFIKNSKRKYGQVELRLNMGLTDTQATLLDNAYSKEIAAAYDVVDGIFTGKDFAFAPDKGIKPYQKFPRGVFVFLIYK